MLTSIGVKFLHYKSSKFYTVMLYTMFAPCAPIFKSQGPMKQFKINVQWNGVWRLQKHILIPRVPLATNGLFESTGKSQKIWFSIILFENFTWEGHL